MKLMHSSHRGSFSSLENDQSTKGFKKILLETLAIILIASTIGAIFVYGFDRDEDLREAQVKKWQAERH